MTSIDRKSPDKWENEFHLEPIGKNELKSTGKRVPFRVHAKDFYVVHSLLTRMLSLRMEWASCHFSESLLLVLIGFFRIPCDILPHRLDHPPTPSDRGIVLNHHHIPRSAQNQIRWEILDKIVSLSRPIWNSPTSGYNSFSDQNVSGGRSTCPWRGRHQTNRCDEPRHSSYENPQPLQAHALRSKPSSPWFSPKSNEKQEIQTTSVKSRRVLIDPSSQKVNNTSLVPQISHRAFG